MEDPNNSNVGIEQPLMDDYKVLLNDPYFQPGREVVEKLDASKVKKIPLRWGGAEDSEGVEFKVKLEKTPVFFDMELPVDMNLMIEVNGRWFYKKPGVQIIDVMSAFFNKDSIPVKPGEEVSVVIFAPPADGENPDTGKTDWAVNYRTEMKVLPKFRIRYEACKPNR